MKLMVATVELAVDDEANSDDITADIETDGYCLGHIMATQVLKIGYKVLPRIDEITTEKGGEA